MSMEAFDLIQLWIVYFALQCVLFYRWIGIDGMIGSMVGTLAVMLFHYI
jgi:hypothetical protein